MPVFPSESWVLAFADAINGSSDYAKAAEGWEGDVAFVFGAEPDKGLPEDVWAWLDLWHGACRGAKIVTPEEGERSRYVIRAPYSRWKEVLAGELDPVRGMMQGKLKVQGDLPTIIRYVAAANELVNLTGTVPTEYLDES